VVLLYIADLRIADSRFSFPIVLKLRRQMFSRYVSPLLGGERQTLD
jgi:hypothetical protein